ncbi:hypothetical protein K435DRAFT_726764 [Dendrothele bispora CBS 962.96]|uniref:Thioredoxin-like protein n=1 Tax=Dendrothele bispora (strain CBS 962.96) TaxID=1314807 RepID=A0A4S8LQZ3_DENBC|nr:hypothetical protein K435DRAFT_726764 [Dendrothele bispora CBS 962.96]
MSSADAVPDGSNVEKASALDIYDAEGKIINFGSLFADKKVVVVFIRTYFCGDSQQYVEQLANIPKEKLDNANVDLVVIGCGDWKPINGYAKDRGFQGSKMYADPDRKLYHELGMDIETLAKTPTGQKKRSYLKRGDAWDAVRSTFKGPVMNPSWMGKQGNLSQLGGDFVFGPGNQCIFAHRMQHTEDHVEVVDLMKQVGIEI